MSIYDQIGINYNKGTKRVNSVAPGCTIEYEADEPEREVRPVYVRRPNPWAKYATDRKLNSGKLRDAEAKPGYTIHITSMEDKDLDNWNTGKKEQLGEVPDGFTIAPAYNKGAYQVVPNTDTDAYTNRK